MNKLHFNQKGIGHLGLLLALVVVGAVAVVGLRVMNSSQTSSVKSTVASTPVKVPAKLATKADVQKAAAALDSTNVETGVNPNQLDKDLNALF